jgi:hypothetical protein
MYFPTVSGGKRCTLWGSSVAYQLIGRHSVSCSKLAPRYLPPLYTPLGCLRERLGTRLVWQCRTAHTQLEICTSCVRSLCIMDQPHFYRIEWRRPTVILQMIQPCRFPLLRSINSAQSIFFCQLLSDSTLSVVCGKQQKQLPSRVYDFSSKLVEIDFGLLRSAW